MFSTSDEFETLETSQSESVPTIQELLVQNREKDVMAKSYMQLIVITVLMILAMIYSALSEQNGNTDMRQVNLGFRSAQSIEEFIEFNNGTYLEFDFKRIFVQYQQIQFENTLSSQSRSFISEFNRIFFGAQLDGSFLNLKDLKLLATCSEQFTPLRDRIQNSIITLAEDQNNITALEDEVLSSQVKLAKQYLEFRQKELTVLRKRNAEPIDEPKVEEGEEHQSDNNELEENEEEVDNQTENNLESANEKLDSEEPTSTDTTEPLIQKDEALNTTYYNANNTQATNSTDSISTKHEEIVQQVEVEQHCVNIDYESVSSEQVDQMWAYIRFSIDKLHQISGENLSWLGEAFLLKEIQFITNNLMELDEEKSEGQYNLHKQYLSELASLKAQQQGPESSSVCVELSVYESHLIEDFKLRRSLLELRVELNEKILAHKAATVALKQSYESDVNEQLQLLVDSYFKCIRLD